MSTEARRKTSDVLRLCSPSRACLAHTTSFFGGQHTREHIPSAEGTRLRTGLPGSPSPRSPPDPHGPSACPPSIGLRRRVWNVVHLLQEDRVQASRLPTLAQVDTYTSILSIHTQACTHTHSHTFSAYENTEFSAKHSHKRSHSHTKSSAFANSTSLFPRSYPQPSSQLPPRAAGAATPKHDTRTHPCVTHTHSADLVTKRLPTKDPPSCSLPSKGGGI